MPEPKPGRRPPAPPKRLHVKKERLSTLSSKALADVVGGNTSGMGRKQSGSWV